MPKLIDCLSRQQASALRAGDTVAITTQVLLVAPSPEATGRPFSASLSALVAGRICCLVTEAEGLGTAQAWRIARIDDPAVDQVACSMLAAGAWACLGGGQCSAALSYALRKYEGLYFRVDVDWLTQMLGERTLPPFQRAPDLIRYAPLDVSQVALTVAHDAHGSDLEHSG